MSELLVVVVLAVSVSFVCIQALRPFAEKVGLVDLPTHRKRHQGAVPLIGGLALYVSIVITSSMLPELTQRVGLWLACAGILVVIGALDDKFEVPASARLSVQALVSLAMTLGSGVSLSYLGDLCGLGSIELGPIAIPITVLAIVTAINAFNMVDGLDGLLGIHTIVAVGGIALLMVFSGGHPLFYIALAVVGALVPYLIFNVFYSTCSGKKIFMGDAGSMLIGFAVVWLLIESTHGENISFRPIVAVWLIALPLMDSVSTITRRLRKRRSPFRPDRTHLHHIFQRMGYSPRQTLVIVSLMSISIASLGILGEVLGVAENLMFLSFLILFACYDMLFGRRAWKVVRFVRKVRRLEKVGQKRNSY